MKKIFNYIFYVVIAFFSFAIKYNALTNITVMGETLIPFFDKAIYKYNIYTNKEEININANLDEDDNYVDGIGNIKLQNGENNIKLKLVLKNGNIKYYYLSIFLNYENNFDSSNSMLKTLVIENYNIDFNPSIFNYSINIEDEDNLNITYIPMDYESNIVLEGNSNLKLGNNKIIITVISKDKKNKSIYTININKTTSVFNNTEVVEKEKNLFNREALTSKEKTIIKIMLISIISIILIYLFYLFFFLKKSRKSKLLNISHNIPHR